MHVCFAGMIVVLEAYSSCSTRACSPVFPFPHATGYGTSADITAPPATDVAVPGVTVIQVTAGMAHTCALTSTQGLHVSPCSAEFSAFCTEVSQRALSSISPSVLFSCCFVAFVSWLTRFSSWPDRLKQSI